MKSATTSRVARQIAVFSATVALAVIWWITIELGGIEAYIFPSPVQVAAKAIARWDQLLDACWVTVQNALIGYGLSILIGIPLAFLLDTAEGVRRTLYPILVGLQVVPVVVFAPILVIWFGFSSWPQIITVVLMCSFPIIVETYTGIAASDPRRLQLARSMGASSFKIFYKIKLPGALPGVFSGLKIGITLALVGAIVAEFISSSNGIGYLLLRATSELESALLIAGVLYVSAISFFLYKITEWLEAIFIPWHSSQRLV